MQKLYTFPDANVDKQFQAMIDEYNASHAGGAIAPEMYGAKGDGSTVDIAAFSSAVAEAVKGKTLILRPGANYNLGSISGSVFAYTNAQLQIVGNGATITVNTTSGQSFLFSLTNPLYVIEDNLTFSDTGADIAQTWKGAHFNYVIASGNDNGFGNVTLRDVRTTSGVTALTVTGGTAYGRISNIRFEGTCLFTNTYYGPVFQNQGDNVSGSWKCVNCRRAYYAYGVRNHDVTVNVHHDGINVQGSTGAVEIVSNTADDPLYWNTRGLRVKANFSGDLTNYGSCVSFTSIGTGPGVLPVVNDVRVDLSLTDAKWGDEGNYGLTVPVKFEVYGAPGGTVEPTIAFCAWDNIRLSGDFYRGSFAQSIVVSTEQTPKGHIVIDDMLSSDMASLPGFYTSFGTSQSGQWGLTDASAAGLTFTNPSTYYHRMGSQVSATFSVTFPETTDEDYAKFGGLPFLPSVFGGGYTAYTDVGEALTFVLNAGESFVYPYLTSGARPTNLQLSGKTIRGTVTYTI